MRRTIFLGFASLVGVTALAAEIVITSLNGNGDLTWTNSVSNATYRVEWAGSATGPWNRFDALTNLSSISATNKSVTVQVPMFYRIVWTDAPQFAGLYDLREYDTNGELVVAGRLSLTGERGSGSVRGTRNLEKIGRATNELGDQWVYGPQIGPGTVAGGFTDSSASMILNLKPQVFDNNVDLSGYLVGDTYLGFWAWTMNTPQPFAEGTFIAVKQNAAGSLPPPDPRGTWDYTVGGPANLLAKGQLTFSTATNPAAGTWRFDRWDPSLPTEHLLGDGSFTNAIISSNVVSISISSERGTFTLDGQMSGDFYAGFSQWPDVPSSGKGLFKAKRRTSP